MFYNTEANSRYLRRIELADLPYYLAIPLENDLFLEVQRHLAQQPITTAGANAQGATSAAAETATDNNAATATSAADVAKSATPVFEPAAGANPSPTLTDYLTEFAKELDMLVAEPNATSAAQN